MGSILEAVKRAALKALESRKFWALIFTLAAMLMTTKLGLTDATAATVIQWVGTVGSAFLVGQGIGDSGLKEAIAERARKAKDLAAK
jgi:hypothetical protein